MFLNLIILFFKLNLIYSQIIIPFTTIKENITSSDYVSTFMYSSFNNKIITKIKIGNPSQEIPLRIKTLRVPLSINSIRMGTYKTILFNESNSSSYIPLHEKPYYYGELDFTNAIKSKEEINFGNNLILKNISFLLGIENNKGLRESGVLGLNLPDSDHRVKDVTFIKQLKERDLINNYTFFIEYEKDSFNESNKGNLILGIFPHEYNKDKYDINKFKEFYAEIVGSTMGFKINQALYGNNNETIDEDFKVQLAVEDNFIRGNKIFKEFFLNNFFNKYITKRICFESKFSYLDETNSQFFYCEKKVNLSQFQNIKLIVDNFGINENDNDGNNNTNLIIELNYEDLFTEFDNKYYFLMYFPDNDYESTYFKLGKVLFQKYLINFNLETKKIGFYFSDKEGKEDNNNDNDGYNEEKKENIIPWILVGILIFIVMILIGFIIYINPCKKRTKRANELIDDNYTYEEGINQS